MNRIERTFKKLGKSGRKALIPYIMAGDPDLEATKKYIHDLESSGADIIELGVPFSDPLADGPTIQRAAERSLQKGTTLRKVLGLVKEIRKTSEIPLILMTYYNPIFKLGIESFITKAVKAGVDGVIIPDLIPDEADEFMKLSRQHNLNTIFLLAPTSTDERIRKVTKAYRFYLLCIYYRYNRCKAFNGKSYEEHPKDRLQVYKKTCRSRLRCFERQRGLIRLKTG